MPIRFRHQTGSHACSTGCSGRWFEVASVLPTPIPSPGAAILPPPRRLGARRGLCPTRRPLSRLRAVRARSRLTGRRTGARHRAAECRRARTATQRVRHDLHDHVTSTFPSCFEPSSEGHREIWSTRHAGRTVEALSVTALAKRDRPAAAGRAAAGADAAGRREVADAGATQAARYGPARRHAPLLRRAPWCRGGSDGRARERRDRRFRGTAVVGAAPRRNRRQQQPSGADRNCRSPPLHRASRRRCRFRYHIVHRVPTTPRSSRLDLLRAAAEPNGDALAERRRSRAIGHIGRYRRS